MSTLSTTEALVIDGANGVTRASRESFPFAAWSLASAIVTIIVLVSLRRFAPRWLGRGLIALLVLAAVPGVVQVLGLRADAPLRRWSAAEPIVTSTEQLRRSVPWPKRIDVRHEDDDVTFPLSRYAAPTRTETNSDWALEVRGAKLPLTCQTERSITRCEALP